MKKLAAFCSSALMITLFTAAISFITGWKAGYVASALIGLTLLTGFVKMPEGSLFLAVTKMELVERELLKQFDNMQDDFMAKIRAKNEAVKYNTIRMTDIGADPDVLIDNAVYPINTAGRVDDDVVLSLRKFDSENTSITDDELHALHYDKKSSVLERHKIALFKKYRDLSLHSLAPAGDTANTPVIKTTGAAIGNRKKLTINDLLAHKLRLDNLDIPLEDRLLCLCNEHATDLLEVDQVFKDQYHKIMDGKILPMYGFWITQNTYKNQYAHDTLAKLAFGAAPGANDRVASTVICSPNAVRARGSAKMYYRDAVQDPENRESVVGFRMYGICIPTKNVGFGAIVSDSNV